MMRGVIELIKKFKESGAHIQAVEAEEILFLRDERYRDLLSKVEQTDGYQRRVETEKEGVRQINTGEYNRERYRITFLQA